MHEIKRNALVFAIALALSAASQDAGILSVAGPTVIKMSINNKNGPDVVWLVCDSRMVRGRHPDAHEAQRAVAASRRWLP